MTAWTSEEEQRRRRRKRILRGLLVGGADIGVMEDGRFVLYEANAAMTMSEPAVLTPDLVRRMQPILDEVEGGLRRHLANPSRWRMAPGRAA